MDYDFSESYKPADAASGIRRCVCWRGLDAGMDGGGSGVQQRRSLLCAVSEAAVPSPGDAQRGSRWEEEDGILPSSSPLG